eukprot:821702-Alexandrium_andersonii.AAC.1
MRCLEAGPDLAGDPCSPSDGLVLDLVREASSMDIPQRSNLQRNLRAFRVVLEKPARVERLATASLAPARC